MAKGCHCQAPALHSNKTAAGIPASHAHTISRGKREGHLLLVSLSKSKQTFSPKLLHNHSHFSLTRILGDNHKMSCCPNFDGGFHKPKFYRQSTPMGCCLVGVILGRPISSYHPFQLPVQAGKATMGVGASWPQPSMLAHLTVLGLH